VTSADRLEGLDLPALDRYLRSLGIERDGDLRADFISGGRSNLTFRLYDDKTNWLLRRPPMHGLTPSAHDMAREYKVVAALQDTPVPVARAIALCEDDSVLGAPFQIVEFVAGQVVRRRAQLESLSHTVIDGCVDSLIRVLVDLHSVDPNAVGLGDFGKPSGYLDRQVRRWGSNGSWCGCPTTTATPTSNDCIPVCANPFRSRTVPRSCTATTGSTTPSWTPTTRRGSVRCSTGSSPRWATHSAMRP
jgi:aminoglycoside phosphotransferase (APT) family kinase protein